MLSCHSRARAQLGSGICDCHAPPSKLACPSLKALFLTFWTFLQWDFPARRQKTASSVGLPPGMILAAWETQKVVCPIFLWSTWFKEMPWSPPWQKRSSYKFSAENTDYQQPFITWLHLKSLHQEGKGRCCVPSDSAYLAFGIHRLMCRLPSSTALGYFRIFSLLNLSVSMLSMDPFPL